MAKKEPLSDTEQRDAIVNDKAKHKDVVYWSGAKRHSIANFVPEVKTAGIIDKAEVPILFFEHVYTAKTPEEVEFIEKSRGFGSSVHRCNDLKEARRRTLARDVQRASVVGKPIETESTSKELVR